ncbi:hypothetical protein F2Q69_00013409 [Brassica cretica]|uniref:Uncharacterized protein n=1 Tax=Brassica cretica TaxID=69181 RepID=A0A8S9QTV7_BRACR|nr:hypothetical protein F2Q69_00013409 [Brassica cretica]
MPRGFSWLIATPKQPNTRTIISGIGNHKRQCTTYASQHTDDNLGELTVGVENGYDKVNVQIPEEENVETFFDKYFFENRLFFTKSFAEETRVIGQELEKGSLRSDRTRAPLGRYVATKLERSLSRYVATELDRSLATELEQKLGRYAATECSSARSLRCDRALPKRRYDISPCILVYPSMLSPEDRSEPISHSPPF